MVDAVDAADANDAAVFYVDFSVLVAQRLFMATPAKRALDFDDKKDTSDVIKKISVSSDVIKEVDVTPNDDKVVTQTSNDDPVPML